ncbi:MAG: hypothetical protein J0G32_00515 [Alphaproteobacteria bacterium]|nr:hypothetical protein [Alphaproteobacteria bacterium]OJV17253.1 MAG: hypothetical protein BGO27_06225 [Alphaproteobacteria bacterium 33-17]
MSKDSGNPDPNSANNEAEAAPIVSNMAATQARAPQPEPAPRDPAAEPDINASANPNQNDPNLSTSAQSQQGNGTPKTEFDRKLEKYNKELDQAKSKDTRIFGKLKKDPQTGKYPEKKGCFKLFGFFIDKKALFGGLGGAVLGFMVGGPIGAAFGACLGGGFPKLGNIIKKKAKEYTINNSINSLKNSVAKASVEPILEGLKEEKGIAKQNLKDAVKESKREMKQELGTLNDRKEALKKSIKELNREIATGNPKDPKTIANHIARDGFINELKEVKDKIKDIKGDKDNLAKETKKEKKGLDKAYDAAKKETKQENKDAIKDKTLGSSEISTKASENASKAAAKARDAFSRTNPDNFITSLKNKGNSAGQSPAGNTAIRGTTSGLQTAQNATSAPGQSNSGGIAPAPGSTPAVPGHSGPNKGPQVGG